MTEKLEAESKSEPKSEYCGMACTALLEDQMKILEQCILHSKYDKEFAPIMVQRLIDQAQQVKDRLESERDAPMVTIESP